MTTSLETSKRLAAAGWPQDINKSYFWWSQFRNTSDSEGGKRTYKILEDWSEMEKSKERGYLVDLEQYAAPTTDDLLAVLPQVTLEKCKVVNVELYAYRALYLDQEDKNDIDCLAETPAEALAQLALTLVEKGVMKF